MTIINRINWRYILIHLLAFGFCFAALETLFLLSDTELLHILGNTPKAEQTESIKNAGINTDSLSSYAVKVTLAPLAGLIISLLFSIIICVRLKLKWYNPVILLTIFIILNRYILHLDNLLKEIFWPIGRLAGNILVEVIINSCILLGITLILFFNGRIVKFIKAGNN
jgi:hypothetical protein